MRETWIVQSKLTPPTPPPGWLYREALPAGNALPTISLMVAGPGYGKTLALTALTMRAERAGMAVLYYQLDLYDADPATFFHYLLAGMRAHIPQFGEEVEALLVGEKLEPRLLWQRFFQAIASYNLPGLFLVLDDFHHLFETQSELVKAFMYFWDKLPPGTRLAIASRQRLPQGVSKFQAKGTLRSFEENELRFTPQEEEEFMRRRAPEGRIPDGWRRQLQGLDGWPLGLDLATTVAEGREIRLSEREAGSERLMEYVAEELYEAQSSERREFMLRAALLQELTPEACRWVFQALDAAQHLDALEEIHLVQRLANGVGYRFPTYLRDFLQAEAERTLPGLAFADWHRRAANYYQDRGAEELALPHLIACGDWAGAAVACELSFPAMRFSGRQSLIARWLDSFPEAIAAEEPVVQLWRGHYCSRSGQMAEALPAYDRAYALYDAREDQAGAFKVLVRQCTLALLQDETKRFGQLLMRAQALQGEGKDEDVVDLYLTRALAAEQRGDMALMRECNEAVLGIAVGENIEIAASQCIALMNLYTLALHQGDLARADRHIANAIAIADTWRFYPYHLFASFLQAHLRVAEGDVERAGAFLRTLPAHWTDVLDWHDLACAYTVLGYYHQAKGDWKEADDALKRSYATFEKAGFKEGLKVPLERMLWQTISRKQYARTGELLSEVGDAASRNIYDLALAIPHARARHLDGDPQGAIAAFTRAIPELEGLGADLHLARALLYEGAARFRVGDASGAEKAVERALALAEAKDYGFLPGQDQSLWEELAPLVIEKRIRVGFVEQALSAAAQHEVTLIVPAAPEVAPAEPPAEAPDSEKPAKKGKAAAPAPAATRPGRLSMHCFGGFEVRLDGILLDQWPRRKAKLILAALLLYHRGLTLTRLAEVLGAEEVTPGNLTTLKVDVSSLRKTLEPTLDKGGSSRYVDTDDDRYVIVPETVEFLDLKAFENAISEGDMVRDHDAAAAAGHYEQALSHYRGNLLEDSFFLKFFEAERERYRQSALAALMFLAEFRRELGDNHGAENHLRRAVEIAPCEEDAYIALMRQQVALGRPERVRQVYWDCRKALKAHIGITPSDEFEAAYKAISVA